MQIRVDKPTGDADFDWLRQMWVSEWGDDIMISKGLVHHLEDLSALIAWKGDIPVGAAAYRLDDDCELLSLNAIEQGHGVGTALLNAVETTARVSGRRRVWLISSNDNIDALKFYQRQGYRMIAVHPNGVDIARRIKPSIPTTGYYDIPLHDEIELEKRL